MAHRSRCQILAAACLLLIAPGVSLALRLPSELDALGEREREVLEAIAVRAPEQRYAALVATRHADVLVRVELIQARSSAAFDLRVQRLDREHQEELWELVRTPGALSDLVAGGVKSEAQLEAIAKEHPEPVRDPIRHLGGEHIELLREADAIKASADVEFEEEIATLPESARKAFQTLVEDPELLAMLARSPSAVVAIGQVFEADPDGTRASVDDLAVEVAAANSAIEEEWREGLANDPEAQAELEDAAREYAAEYGYDYDELTTERVVHHYYGPYPYWYGYPRWYSYWYPWGVWSPVYPHFGFHYGRRHNHVYYGLPSLHFVHWFYGGHHGHYRHVARHFDHRSHGHHRSSHAVYRTVRRHERHGNWGKHRHGSPERIYGRSYRSRDHRGDRTRRSSFRTRWVRTPDASFGRRGHRVLHDPRGRRGKRHVIRTRDHESGKVHRAQPRLGGDRSDRTERVRRDGPRKGRGGIDRSRPRSPNGTRGTVERVDRRRRADPAARPKGVRPRVASERGRSPARVERTPRSPKAARRVERARSAPSPKVRSRSSRRTGRSSGTKSRAPAFRSEDRAHSAGRSPRMTSGNRAKHSSSGGGPRHVRRGGKRRGDRR